MNTRQIINSVLDSQPEGRELLNTIKVDFESVKEQYTDCLYFQKVTEIKFSIDRLKTGLSLKEILDGTQGITAEEVERFVLAKLQIFVNTRAKNK